MAKKQYVCASCKFVGEPNQVTPGSGLVELALYFFGIFPGLIYSHWRGSNKKTTCRICGGMVHDVDSPEGIHLLKISKA